ncbi:hypothetical protein G3I77_15965 [Streptomyces sp. D2-8]|uniref:hypothetical protein n=1 Tax=Streptomyces sp. D2-8 TaxID=2707767 RepID=UPI0020C02F56|nr:hypothetical protein [Streptomyces sp. D2-8]MCK8434462.1 hypothetical protein [Streptomyces sp. D2-8]
MRYRNKVIFSTSIAMVAAMTAVAVYFLFLDSGAPKDVWEVSLALSLPCGVGWMLIRIGITPFTEWNDTEVKVCNPFFTYRAGLDKVRLFSREGRGGAFELEGIGMVMPWSMTRSILDGKRANGARRDLRHAVLRAQKTMETDAAIPTTRRLRYGWFDILIIPLLAAFVWAFLP